MGRLAAHAQDPAAAAKSLAAKIPSTAPGNPAMSVNFRNLSGANPAGFAALRRLLEAELTRRGVRIVPAGDSAAFAATITLSRSIRGLLWVAAVSHDGMLAIEMEPAGELPMAPGQAFHLHAERLWTQTAPVLDFALVTSGRDGPTLAVLTPDAIVFHPLSATRTDGPGPQLAAALVHNRAQRDPRGHLLVREQTLEAYLPGEVCRGPLGGTVFDCQSAGDWPLDSGTGHFRARLDASKNIFIALQNNDGEIQAAPPAFFSFVVLGGGGTPPIFFTTPNGDVLAVSQHASTVLRDARWGSQITALGNSCDPGRQVLASSTSDASQADSLTLFDVIDLQPVAVSAPLAFAGPVTALWSSQDEKSARVVARNLQTESYEAYVISSTCGP